MKIVLRPLAAAGFSFAAVLLIASFCRYPVLLGLCGSLGIVCVIGVILVVCGRLCRRAVVIVLFFAAAAAGVALNGRAALIRTAMQWAGEEVAFSGRIDSVWDGDTVAYLICAEAGDLEPGIRVLVYSGTAPEFFMGETVSLTAELSDTPPTSSQLGRGADLLCYAAGGIRLEKEAAGWRSWISNLREDMRQRLYSAFKADAAAFFEAVLLGNSDALSDSVRRTFSATGTSHLLCISGLHISMIMCFFGWFFRRFPGGKSGFALTGLAGGVFVLFTGAAASSMRAWIMAMTALAAQAVCRDYSPSNALGSAVLLLSLLNPRVVLQIGFWLSVLATAAMFGVAPRWTEALCSRLPAPLRRNRASGKILSVLCGSMAVNLLCLPVFFLWIGSIPLLSPVANLLLVPIFPFLMAAGMLGLAGGGWAEPFGRLVSWVLDGIFHALDVLSGIPGSSLPLGIPWIWIWAGFALLLLLTALPGGKKRLRLAVCFIAVLLTAGMASWSFRQTDALTVFVVSTESGGSLVLESGGRAVIVGCGGDGMIGGKTASFLKSRGVRRLDAVLVPEETRRCMGGVADLAGEFPVGTLYSGTESNWYQTALDSPEIGTCLLLEAGEYRLFDHFEMEIARVEDFVRIAVTANGRRLLFLSGDDPGAEKVSVGVDAIFLYDEIAGGDGIPVPEYAIIESRQSWLDCLVKIGSNYAAAGFLEIFSQGEMRGSGL